MVFTLNRRASTIFGLLVLTDMPSKTGALQAAARPSCPSTSTTHTRHEPISLMSFIQHNVGMSAPALRAAERMVSPSCASTRTPSMVTLSILGSTSFENAAAVVVAAQAASAFLDGLLAAHGVFHALEVALALARRALGDFHAAARFAAVGMRARGAYAAVEGVIRIRGDRRCFERPPCRRRWRG